MKIFRKELEIVYFSILLCISSSSIAATYNELINGDLSDDYYGVTNIGALQAGNNTVSGTVSLDYSSTHDWDHFLFEVSPGSEIVSISLSYSITDSLQGAYFRLKQGETWGDSIFLEDVMAYDYISSPVQAYESFMPISEGIYSIYTSSMSGSNGTLDYQWSIDVSTVPVPATVWLLGSGLIGLVGLAKRKKI